MTDYSEQFVTIYFYLATGFICLGGLMILGAFAFMFWAAR